MNTKFRSKLLSILIGMLVLSLCFIAGTAVIGTAAATPNDVTACNVEISETQAVTVDYNGEYTGRYGLQAYAGLSGAAWILGDTTMFADQGAGSHVMGSNASDGRNNFAMTFSINSSVAGDAYIYLNVQTSDNESLQVVVNGGEPTTHLITDEGFSSLGLGMFAFRPEIIKVTLVEGINIITLTTGENYAGWYHAFAISPKADYKVVEYSGETTGKYAVQTYANLSGAAWGFNYANASNCVDFGKGAGPIGSNSWENRSNFKMALNVNSTVAGKAYLYLYVQNTSVNEPLTVKVNDAEAFTFSLASEGNIANYFRPQVVEVTLVEGTNTIVLTTGTNYHGWYHSFEISPNAPEYKWVAPTENAQSANYSPADWVEIGGYFDSGNTGAIGLNAQDDAANYGKTGYAVFEIYAENAGSYTFGMSKMSGSTLSNRVKITLNGNVLQFGGKDYYAFDTSAGWAYAWDYVQLELVEGKNTIKIETQLVYVLNNAEVAEGTAGAVGMTNWWINAFSLTKNSNVQLELDTSNVQKTYNPGWKPTTVEGLIVYLVVDGVKQDTPLSSTEYEAVIEGDLVNVSYAGSAYSGVQGASYSLSQTDQGVAREGQTVTMTSDGTDRLSWYNYAAVTGEGTGVCEGRLFWIVMNQPTADGGYVFGSQGAGEHENRQMTLTLTINNTGEAGQYLFKSYINAREYAKDYAWIKVNSAEYEEINIYALLQSNEYYPYVYIVNLVEGENTITLKLCEQYSAWFETFEICSIEYTDKAEYTIADAARDGLAGYDTANGLITATSAEHSLTYFVSATEAGKFELSFFVSKSTGKTFKVSIDGKEATVLTTIGKDSVSMVADLTQGNHTVKLIFDAGDNSSMDFIKMTKVLCKVVTAIRVDTSGMNLEVEKGTALNLSKMKVYVTYKDETGETLIQSGYTVNSSSYNANQAGTYTIEVCSTAFTDVKTTFDITVKAEKVVNGIEVDASQISSLANGATLDISKLVVKICYSDNTKLPAMSSDYSVTAPENFDNKVAGEYTFTVTYAKDSNISTTFKVTVAAAENENGGNNGGCGSSIGAASLMLGVLAFSGASIVLAKKKED